MRSIHHDTLDSTNDEARRLLSRYPGEVVCVTANQQTAGRGRHGRTWHAPRGGVWLSLAWPAQHEPTWYEATPIVAALAAWQAVASCLHMMPAEASPSDARLRIKWPNDLLLDGRKVAGVLCEQVHGPHALIVGIGINANLDVRALPGNLRQPAASLCGTLGQPVDLAVLSEALATALAGELTQLDQHGFTDETRRHVEQRLAFVGQTVVLHTPHRATPGQVRGLAADGGLVLDVANQRKAFTVGEVQQLQRS